MILRSRKPIFSLRLFFLPCASTSPSPPSLSSSSWFSSDDEDDPSSFLPISTPASASTLGHPIALANFFQSKHDPTIIVQMKM
uniref:Putative secreted protein n=1 Tax=Anopheles marajoara TaxID=58244 RepID=A0A2M4CCB6_9DIPT